jgi:metal transporter CNNM
MAIVVPVALDASETQQKDGTVSRKLLWTASETACTGSSHSASEHTPIDHAENLNADPTLCRDQSISALRSPKPIGIVTYKDIVNAILQKPNPEESDFLNGCNMPPPRKCKNALGRVKFACSYVQNRYGAPISRQKSTASRPSIPSTMRRRNVSAKLPESTEARTTNEIGELNNGVTGIETPVSAKYQNNNTEMTCVQNTANTRCGESQSVRRTESSSLTLTESLPSRKGFSAVLPNGSAPSWRHVSAAPRLPQLQRVTPFSRQGYSSYENIDEEHSISGGVGPSIHADSPSVGCGIQSVEGLETRKSEFQIPEGSKCATIPEDSVGGSCEDSQEAFSLVSWCPAGFVDVNEWNSHLQEPTTCTTRLETSCTSIPSSEALVPEGKPEILPYQGFPPELLTNTRKENRFPSRASNTLPRMIGQLIDLDAFSEKDDSTSQQQDESPHADRTLLPSQRRIANDSTVLAISGARSSSFWV